jgi:serine/threonine protein kinase
MLGKAGARQLYYTQRFIREALILQLVQHPNILRFTSIVNEPYKICIITPWYAQGHIMKYIEAFPDAEVKELVRCASLKRFHSLIQSPMNHQMEQVADGLHFLSEYRIVHGDLKGVRLSNEAV